MIAGRNNKYVLEEILSKTTAVEGIMRFRHSKSIPINSNGFAHDFEMTKHADVKK